MHTLTVSPIATVVLGQMRPWFQNITPEQAAQYANQIQKSKAGQWYIPGKGPSYTSISEEEAEHLMDTGGVTPQPSTPQQFLARLRDGVRQFGQQFNQSTVRPYNNAIQHALKAIENLSQAPEISPEIERQGDKLLKLFQDIQASDAEDVKLVNQLGQIAYALGMSAGAYQPGAATNMQTRAPQQAQPTKEQPQEQPKEGLWQRMQRHIPSWSRAAETNVTLTAEVGSAARLLK